MYRVIRSLDRHEYKSDKFLRKCLYILASPVVILLEMWCKRNIWWKKVVRAMIENDKCFRFLDENGFEFYKGCFRKCELLDENEFYRNRDLNETRNLIRKDFMSSFINSIQYIPEDIDRYINMIVKVYTKTSQHPDTGEYMYANVYEVIIRYYREYQIGNIKKYLRCFEVLVLVFVLLSLFMMYVLSNILQ